MNVAVASHRGAWRRSVKVAVFTTSLLVCLPLILIAWLEKLLSKSEELFILCGQILATAPGFLGRWLRGAYYFGTLDQCSWETHIGFGSLFTHRQAEVGPRASIGAYCVLGHVRIGRGVMMGSRVSIPSGKRQHMDDEGRLASTTRFDRVEVGAHSWIGEGAIIMAPVGERSIVSAGAVVSKEVPPGTLVAGNPAVVVRNVHQAAPADAEG